MSKYLDSNGLTYLWSKIKDYIASHGGSGGGTLIPYVKTTNTAAGAALTGSCPELTELTEGQSIILHLSYGAGSNATLNLTLAGGVTTGAVNCYYSGTTRLGTHYAAGNDIRLTYHKNMPISGSGSYTGWWAEGNYYNDTNTVPTAYCTTAAATAAKAATCTNYVLTANTYLVVLISTANSYNGAITLNVNSKGAKPIYINGAASSSSNKTLPAGTYIVYYDGTNYHFRTDGVIPGSVMEAKSLSHVTLFTGDSTGNVTLAQSAANFSMLEIFYEGYNGANPQSMKILSPNGRKINLSIVETGGSATQTRIRRAYYTINGTSITNDATASGYVMVADTGNTHTIGTNVIHITRVDGYV